MKIAKQKIEVQFENYSEAARWLFGYMSPKNIPGAPEAQTEFGYLGREHEVNVEIARQAVAEVARRIGAAAIVPTPDPQHAAPTYISGSSDRVYLISEMPTRYIRNVLNMNDFRKAIGLRGALLRELRNRGEGAE